MKIKLMPKMLFIYARGGGELNIAGFVTPVTFNRRAYKLISKQQSYFVV